MNEGDGVVRFEPGLAVYRIAPGVEVRDGIGLVTAAIEAARKAGATRLLLDLRPIAGVAPPGLGQRYAFSAEWARAAQGAIAIAVVAPPELIDPRRYGMQVAHGAGLDGDVFEDEALARAWLARRPAPQDPAG
jgi:hypothetical protein